MRFPIVAAAVTGLLVVAGASAQVQDSYEGVERIVAIGDVHGDFDRFTELLRSAGLVDKKNKWIGGKAHLVQTGDCVDRGPASRKVMDLLMDLEKQARKAGGMVHAIIGNHEAMNIYGDLRYVAKEEYAAFATGDSGSIRNEFFQTELPGLKQKNPDASEDQLRKDWEAEHPLGWYEHRVAFSPKGKYGAWIRPHNSVVKINDLLFLHGGWGPKYATQTVRGINDQVRLELNDFTKLANGMAMDSDGPLWYRGLARGPEAELAAHLNAVLKSQGASAIVMGHTPTAGAVLTRFDGKAILIDVGMSKFYGGPPACLVVEGNKRMALHRGKLLDLPSTPDAILAYLKAAAALDPQPSPLMALISGGGKGADSVKEDK